MIHYAAGDRGALPRVLAGGVLRFARREIKNEGLRSFVQTLVGSVAARDIRFAPDRSFGQELHVRAARNGAHTFLTFEGETYSYAELDDRAARVAQGLLALGLGEGSPIGVLLPNLPAFLEIVFATQRIGACLVPINTALKDDGLRYILDNAEIELLFTTHSLVDRVDAVVGALAHKPKIVLVPEFSEAKAKAKAETARDIPYRELVESERQLKPNDAIDPATSSFLMYTSGTTGYPKGVVYTYGHSQAKLTRLSANLLLGENEIYYTCLPLFHANALMITVFSSLYADATVALSRRFSASGFWDEVRQSRATIFNTIGTMVAILMKTPPTPLDRTHNVRKVLSAACPADLWEPFQQRFGVQLWEAFGAVDGGGFTTFNFGHAPAGSIGKPFGGTKYRLIDEAGKDVAEGESGELIHYVGGRKHGQIEYHHNADATREKVRDGWIYSGDVLRRDAAGFLYFLGRKTDSMRCRGENVSALDVENAAAKYPAVLDSAAYGVPSDMGEQDVMLCVEAQTNQSLDPASLHAFLGDKLPPYAVPRYIRVVPTLPKTGTHRTIKHLLKQDGVTADTWRAPERKAARNVRAHSVGVTAGVTA